MYFRSMPDIVYKYYDKTIVTKDIFKRVGFTSSIVSKVNLVSHYIADGETPDVLAYRFYGSSDYHWLILICNDIVNPYESWPLPNSKVLEMTVAKYGVGNDTATHHYCLAAAPNIVVDYNYSDYQSQIILEVTNYEYELAANDNKRQIFLLKPEYLKDFVNTYRKLMAQ